MPGPKRSTLFVLEQLEERLFFSADIAGLGSVAQEIKHAVTDMPSGDTAAGASEGGETETPVDFLPPASTAGDAHPVDTSPVDDPVSASHLDDPVSASHADNTSASPASDNPVESLATEGTPVGPEASDPASPVSTNDGSAIQDLANPAALAPVSGVSADNASVDSTTLTPVDAIPITPALANSAHAASVESTPDTQGAIDASSLLHASDTPTLAVADHSILSAESPQESAHSSSDVGDLPEVAAPAPVSSPVMESSSSPTPVPLPDLSSTQPPAGNDLYLMEIIPVSLNDSLRLDMEGSLSGHPLHIGDLAMDGTIDGTPASFQIRDGHDVHLTGLASCFPDGPLLLDGDVSLTGSGVIRGAVINSGLVSPGNSPGIQTFDAFTQNADGTLHIEIGGYTAGPGPHILDGFDQLQITGAAALGGKLTVSLLDGFGPQAGDVFDIMTYGSVSGKFSDASGLFGFGDGSLYFDVVQMNDRLRLEVKELSSTHLAIEVASQAAQDQLGLYFNNDYFTDATLEHVAVDGAVHLGDFFHLYGAFSWDVAAAAVDVVTELGRVDDQPVLALEMALTNVDLFVGPGDSYVTARDDDLAVDTDQDGDPTDDYIFNNHAQGLWIQNFNAGLDIMESLIPLAPSYVALKATADEIAYVGSDSFKFAGRDIAIAYNQGDLGAAVDFLSTYGADGLGLTAGGSTVHLDFSTPLTSVSMGEGVASIGDFMFLTGSFAFESGPTCDVDVRTTNALGGEGSLSDVTMSSMTMGISDAYGFVGYAPGGYFLTDPLLTPDPPEINANAVGFAVNDLTAGFVLLQPTLSLDPDVIALDTFMAGKLSVSSAGFMGSDALEVSASGVEAHVNMASSWYPGGNAVVDFAQSFAGGGLSVPTGNPDNPVVIDFADEIMGLSAANVTAKVSDFVFLTGAMALEKGNTYDVTVHRDVGGIAADDAQVSAESMTLGISEAYGFVGYAPDGYFQADADPNADGADADADPTNDWVLNPDA
ncbi:MAG: hypothetical protein HQL63_14245, partial [Magnetococcales bacterium]|nr:hypothetical protein [Magnetococcales bacterium]